VVPDPQKAPKNPREGQRDLGGVSRTPSEARRAHGRAVERLKGIKGGAWAFSPGKEYLGHVWDKPISKNKVKLSHQAGHSGTK